MTGSEGDLTRLVEVLELTAAAIADALAGVSDWDEAGTRSGQHHSDLAADAAAVEVLAGAGVGVLSEESGSHHPERAVTVVVDPLDGSTNAARGLAWWAVSLCAVDAVGPLAALVVDLRHGDRWSALRGRGAWRDGVAIAPSTCTDLARAVIAINGVPAGHGGWAQYRSLGAAALDLCAVADGTLDGYLDATTDELGVWDYLGATLVCREAGAVVSDAWNRELTVLDHTARRTPVAGATAVLHSTIAALHPDPNRALIQRPDRGSVP